MTRAGTFLTAMAAVALVLLPARVLAHGPTAEIVVTPPIVEPGERILVQGHFSCWCWIAADERPPASPAARPADRPLAR